MNILLSGGFTCRYRKAICLRAQPVTQSRLPHGHAHVKASFPEDLLLSLGTEITGPSRSRSGCVRKTGKTGTSLKNNNKIKFYCIVLGSSTLQYPWELEEGNRSLLAAMAHKQVAS